MKQNERITTKGRCNKKHSLIILQKNTQCFLFRYNDKEQNYKQYTDTKIATIGARCETICNVTIFYWKTRMLYFFKKSTITKLVRNQYYYHGIVVCVMKNEYLIECSAIPMPLQIGIAAVHSICHHTSWFLFWCLSLSHLYSQFVYLQTIFLQLMDISCFIVIQYCSTNLNNVEFNTISRAFRFFCQLCNISWLLDSTNVDLSDHSWLYYYYYNYYNNNFFKTYANIIFLQV